MRKASMILGIIGGSMALALSALFIGYDIYLMTVWGNDETALQGAAYTAAMIDILLPGFIAATAGILGLIGAFIVKKKHMTSGVLMIIGAVICIYIMLLLLSFVFIVSIVPLIIASVFALMPERPAQAPQQPALPHIPMQELKP